MALYNIHAVNREDGTMLKLSFGDPASNDEIIKEVKQQLDSLKPSLGGKLVLINGPASLPIACCLAHGIAHLFSCVAVFDPKIQKYVVAISHDSAYSVGDLID